MAEELEAMGCVPLMNMTTYKAMFGVVNVWEADPWQEACLSWKTSCYIHAGISNPRLYIKGPDAQKLLSKVSINDVYKWGVNRCKHLVMCDENGLIQNHALTQRDGENEFCMYAGNPWPLMSEAEKTPYNVELEMDPCFVFQMSGPTALTVIERVTEESQRDVRFLDVKKVCIPGIDGELELCRIGMSGTIAYEFRGARVLGPQVYQNILEAGKDFGIKRLGWKTYTVNHTEGGYPQMTVGFETACVVDPVFSATPAMASIGIQPHTGSIDPANQRARLRTPGEVDWMWMAKFDHDFIGRKALEAEQAAPKRTIVNLEWNVEDVLDIYRSHFEPGEDYKMLEFPCGQPQPAGGHADLVTDMDGKEIGISSCTMYSNYYRVNISQCIIDIDQAQIGREVYVHWGDFGKRIKKVRAKVAKYPYTDLEPNHTYNLDSIPSGVPSQKTVVADVKKQAAAELSESSKSELVSMAEISGFYDVVVDAPTGKMAGNFDFIVDDDKLTGTLTAMGATAPVEEGIVEGSQISFKATLRTKAMGKVNLKVTGTFEKGTISGRMKMGLISTPFASTKTK